MNVDETFHLVIVSEVSSDILWIRYVSKYIVITQNLVTRVFGYFTGTSRQVTRAPGPVPGIGTKITAVTDPDGFKTVLVDEVDIEKELEEDEKA